MVKESTALAVVDFLPPALDENSDLAAAMLEEGIDPSNVDPERIQWPTGGAPFFNVNGEPVKELVFIDIFDHDCNAYWDTKKSDGGENVPPTCASLDGKTGCGDIGIAGEVEPFVRSCATCPMNQFGTGKDQQGNATKGKACKNVRRIFALMEDSLFPRVISIPPTSIKQFINFKANQLLGRGLRSNQVIMGISLVTEKKGSNDVAVIVPRVIGPVAPEMAAKAAAFSAQWKQRFAEIDITGADRASENGNGKDLNSMNFSGTQAEEVM